MLTYVVRRFALMLLTLFGISVIIFALLRLVPGNIADILFDSAGMINPAEKMQIERELGLDKSIPVQYAAWIGGLLHGDLGYSYVSERPALQEILPRIPITAKLAALALAFSILLGVPFGVISAVKQNTWLDYLLRVVSLSGLSMPAFWLGLLILMLFVAQFGSIPIYSEGPKSFWDEFVMFAVPAAWAAPSSTPMTRKNGSRPSTTSPTACASWWTISWPTRGGLPARAGRTAVS